jgi:hypothetical protein
MTSRISIVRLGGAESAALLLRSAIYKHFDAQQCYLTITNKYFQAKVQIEEFSPSQEYENGKEDGIILVFDAESTTTTAANFDSVCRIHDTAEELGQNGDLLRLCVGIKSAAGSNTVDNDENEYARRIHWCLDRGYEYVEADLSDEAVTLGHAERDKEGFARIVEAISGIVWSSADMKAGKKQNETYKPAAASSDVVDDEHVDGTYEPPDPTLLPIVPGAVEASKEREEKARQVLLNESNLLDPTAEMSTYIDDEGKNDPDVLDERQQERFFDSMESALKQASRIRDQSRAGELSDDERRQRAGEAASLLMGLMNHVGFDDSDSEPDWDTATTPLEEQSAEVNM